MLQLNKKNKKMNKVIFFNSAVFLYFLHVASGLRCYTCSYGESDSESDYLCVTAPWNLTSNPIRTCPPHFKFCIIVRTESKITEKVTSFLRKCEENPQEDSDVDSITIVSHYRSCTTDLCNKGDGLNFIDEGHDGESVAILVPDKDSSVLNKPNAILIIFLSVIFFQFNI